MIPSLLQVGSLSTGNRTPTCPLLPRRPKSGTRIVPKVSEDRVQTANFSLPITLTPSLTAMKFQGLVAPLTSALPPRSLMVSARHVTLATIGATALMMGTTQAAHAGTFYNGWNYGIDAVGDGSGGSTYDIKGIAVKSTADTFFVSINSNLAITGNAYSGAADGNVGWGDLFLNFTGKSFLEANQNNQLIGIRFASTNDSNASQVGVYTNASAKSVTLDNAGYDTLNSYYAKGFERANTMGTDFATKSAALSYFSGEADGILTTTKTVATTTTVPKTRTETYRDSRGRTRTRQVTYYEEVTTYTDVTTNTDVSNILNVIDKGDYRGGITALTAQEAAAEGLNFNHFYGTSSNPTGTQTITFKFDRAMIDNVYGNFVASIFQECGNDGVAVKGHTKKVPEPSSLLGLTVLGGLLAVSRRLRRDSEADTVA